MAEKGTNGACDQCRWEALTSVMECLGKINRRETEKKEAEIGRFRLPYHRGFKRRRGSGRKELGTKKMKPEISGAEKGKVQNKR